MSRTVHVPEDRLILHLCGEADAAIDAHLAACDACRAAQVELRGTLALLDAAPTPVRGEGYGAEVWRRIRPHLVEQGQRRAAARWNLLFRPRSWALAGTIAALLLAAFLAGRHWPVPPGPISGPARERILLVAVGDHLDRAHMMLVELVNSGEAAPSGPGVDMSGARQRAEELVAANRIYRQATAGAGDAGMAAVLDELERLLLDISHAPSPLAPEDLDRIRRDIEAKGILLKVRFIGVQVREREKARTPGRGSI